MSGKSGSSGRSELDILAVALLFGAINLALLWKLTLLSPGAQERFTRSALAAAREVLAVMYRDKGLPYPEDPADFMGLWRDRGGFPRVRIPGRHGISNSVLVAGSSAEIDDSGGWIYFNAKTVPAAWGTLKVNCTHTDSRGRAWSEY